MMNVRIVFALVVATVVTLASTCAAVRVGAVQMASQTGASPQASTILNAQQILNISYQYAAEADLLVFPEFELYGNFDLGSDCKPRGAVAPLCEPVPSAGQWVNCNASNATASPLAIIACNAPPKLTISYNGCETFVNGSTTHYYNTQVIVRDGLVIAKYRKYHVYDTECFDYPALELVTFDVLGVTFGVFTCFDIVFPDPKEDLVKRGVKYFSYSSAIPLVARDAVKIFSYLNGVNVVSSNLQLGLSSVIVKGKAVSECTSSTELPCVAIADI